MLISLAKCHYVHMKGMKVKYNKRRESTYILCQQCNVMYFPHTLKARACICKYGHPQADNDVSHLEDGGNHGR